MPSYLPCSRYLMELCHIWILVHNLVIFAFCSTNLSYIYNYLKLSQNHILTHIFPKIVKMAFSPNLSKIARKPSYFSKSFCAMSKCLYVWCFFVYAHTLLCGWYNAFICLASLLPLFDAYLFAWDGWSTHQALEKQMKRYRSIDPKGLAPPTLFP